jgi:hypothetical protein
MGNCNTCNCDGKGEAQPNEFNMDVSSPLIPHRLLLITCSLVGLIKTFETVQLANEFRSEPRGAQEEQLRSP